MCFADKMATLLFPAEPEVWQQYQLPACESTNAEVWALLRGQPESTFIALRTSLQTKGRGQRGTSWESAEGQNLLVSLGVNHLKVRPEEAFQLTMQVSLALAEGIQKLTQLETLIKWPNDLLLERQKVAGILIENQIRGKYVQQSVIGIGLNVNQTIFRNPQAISLKLATGQHFPLSALLQRLLRELGRTSQLAPEAIKESYLKQLLGYQKVMEFEETQSQRHFSATILGVDTWGRLKVREESGTLRLFDLKEIRFRQMRKATPR